MPTISASLPVVQSQHHSVGPISSVLRSRITLVVVAVFAVAVLATLAVRFFQTLRLRIATWNIGGLSDFIKSLPQYAHHDLDPLWGNPTDFPTTQTITSTQQDLWQERRHALIQRRIEEAALDVLCLQEIHEDDITVLQPWFTQHNFSIVSDGRDAAVLFRSDRFREIARDIQVRGRNSVSVTLESTSWFRRNKTIIVGSAHITGFSLGNPNEYDGTRYTYQQGDNELAAFTQELVNANAADRIAATFLGIDANSNEEVHPQRIGIPGQGRFVRNTANDGWTTAFNPDLGEAQLDHLYYLEGESSVRLRSLPLEPHILPPSDHKMVVAEVTVTV